MLNLLNMLENGRKKQTVVVYEDGLDYYFNNLKKCKPLKKEEERRLLELYHTNNDLIARQKLISANMRYACSLVNKYRNCGVPLEDLIQEANMGLIDAIDKFDMSKDVKIITYAKWRIEYFLQEAIRKISTVKTDDLASDTEKQKGLNNNSDVTDDEVLDTTSNMYAIDGNDVFKESTFQQDLQVIMGVLNEREVDIIKRYYGISPYSKEYTYNEIGQEYGITKERVRQVIEKIIRKLRTEALIKLSK